MRENALFSFASKFLGSWCERFMSITVMPKNTSTGFTHFCSALRYSVAGLRIGLRETAIRHELYLGFIHFICLFLVHPPFVYALLLSLLWIYVVITEILNTAVEAVVDLVSPQYSPLAGRAKDLGSAAVFVGLVAFGLSWCAVALRSF